MQKGILAATADRSALSRSIVIVIVGSALMALAARIQVPFYPVPMSLQTLVPIAMGLAFGPVVAVSAMLLYLFQGALGFPVFAGTPERGLGLPYMLGPTGGFLIGFVLAAAVAGVLGQFARRRLAATVLIAFLAGASVYLPGLAWLGLATGYGETLLAAGLWPFLPGDVCKALIAGLILYRFRPAQHAVPGSRLDG
ncbi:biotin transporter BioY [Paracoccus sp. S-4012]|uniref:biotin transporter BioY n=1 Tax=Paracoccus sp. S-4012 TaxID=2665648 RepID=UPI0012AFC6C1|nr:biotin transporter BioY [Paracoccus sp. S-4012]MRX48887.1 biotin transporter BioY [Paracoccus sp. S-4012]